MSYVRSHGCNGRYVRGHYRTSSRARARTAPATGLAAVLTVAFVLIVPLTFGFANDLAINLAYLAVVIPGVIVALSSTLARFTIRETIRRPGVGSEIEVVRSESGEKS